MDGSLPVSLDDKYRFEAKVVLASGVQALVRLMLAQAERDAAAGLNTGGYVSGYRGSPLGGLDMEMASAKASLAKAGVVFEPGLNEDLAATAIMGAQQLDAFGPRKVQGVFSLWYGKGPGVDRSGDAFKHGNRVGSSPEGGVIVAFGDDHPGKSSTVAHQSEHAVAASQIPVLYPATVHEVVEYGLLGFALSRFSGLWVGMKLVNETAETTATIEVVQTPIITPNDAPSPPEGVNYVPGAFSALGDEARITNFKLPRARAFARANRIDRLTLGGAGAELCVVTAGKTWADVVEALRLLGIDQAGALSLGLRVYKVGMIWPLEGESLTEAVDGCREALVIEEKNAFLEDQVARALINHPARVRVVGKTDENGVALVRADAQLEPAEIALIIVERLVSLGRTDEAFDAQVDALAHARSGAVGADAAVPARTPYFCSGCPHNSSTRIPEGSVALSGIGCHTMAMWMDRNTLPPTQMGGEGVNWIGAAPFSERRHVFQNLGDGTYSHSGLLAIRASVVAKSNLTYKILFNDAVAMTGGQPVEGVLTVEQVARQVLSEDVERCVVVSDNPEPHKGLHDRIGVRAYHRDDLDAVQRELREIEGVTVLIYDQTCAAEKRRRRKRGEFPDPDRRIFINTAVCEGCGDCTVRSNCVSVLPKETELGRKREIDQSSCNKDYSCVEGFCPSFVSVSGGRPRKVDWKTLVAAMPEPPQPLRRVGGERFSALITGVGGAGVVTVGAVLAMAAHLEGKGASSYNMTGLAQKGGAVFSHLRIASDPAALAGARVGAGEADLLIACDMVVGGGVEAVAALDPSRSAAVVNTHLAPTAAFQRDRDFRIRDDLLRLNLLGGVGEPGRLFETDSTRIAVALFGDSIASNMFMVGYAWQLGLLPLKLASIEQAVRLNRAAIELNLAALRTGRLAAHDPAAIEALVAARNPAPAALPVTLDEVVAHCKNLLSRWQDATYAEGYAAFIDRVRAAEDKVAPGSTSLSVAVAKNLAKLMAYKDEYEVARLYSDPAFAGGLAATFEGDLKVTYHLAPPLLGRRNARGEPIKSRFGPWMGAVFKTLARFKGLRGTPMDVFGWSEERRMERRLIDDYRVSVEQALGRLTAGNLAAATDMASYPGDIRGYGHVKLASVPKAEARRDKALMAMDGPIAVAA